MSAKNQNGGNQAGNWNTGAHSPGEIVIELGTALNQQVKFAPSRATLRGRMDRMNLGAQSSSESAELVMLTIPGMYISLDIDRRAGRIFDPLGLPQNRAELKRISTIHRKYKGHPVTPVEPIEVNDMNDSQIATWYHFMHRMCNEKVPSATLVRGGWLDAPPPGRVKLDFDNTADNPLRYKDQFDKKYGRRVQAHEIEGLSPEDLKLPFASAA